MFPLPSIGALWDSHGLAGRGGRAQLIGCFLPSVPPLVFPRTTPTVPLMETDTVCQTAAAVVVAVIVVAAHRIVRRLRLVVRAVPTSMAGNVGIHVQNGRPKGWPSFVMFVLERIFDRTNLVIDAVCSIALWNIVLMGREREIVPEAFPGVIL